MRLAQGFIVVLFACDLSFSLGHCTSVQSAFVRNWQECEVPERELLGRSERTDHDVIPIRITKCEFAGTGVRVQMGLLFEFSDKGACPK